MDIDSNSIVLDAGAYTGEWAQEIMDRYNPTIHAFEPDPRNYKQLEKRTQANSRLIPYKFGLGDKNETVRMTLELLGSSMFSDTTGKKGVPWAEVEIRDIADTWQALALDRVEFMKINIEGAEFPLLERMIDDRSVRKSRLLYDSVPRMASRRLSQAKENQKGVEQISQAGVGLPFHLGKMGTEIISHPDRLYIRTHFSQTK